MRHGPAPHPLPKKPATRKRVETSRTRKKSNEAKHLVRHQFKVLAEPIELRRRKLNAAKQRLVPRASRSCGHPNKRQHEFTVHGKSEVRQPRKRPKEKTPYEVSETTRVTSEQNERRSIRHYVALVVQIKAFRSLRQPVAQPTPRRQYGQKQGENTNTNAEA